MVGLCLKQVVTATVIILATGSTTTECTAGYPQACGAKFRGLKVENGRVTDVVIAKCGADPKNRPRHHYIEAWIDHRSAGGEWVQVTSKRDAYSQVIPDAEGIEVPVSASCEEGEYRSSYYVEGAGAPIPPDYPEGREFEVEYTDHLGASTYSVGDCVASMK